MLIRSAILAATIFAAGQAMAEYPSRMEIQCGATNAQYVETVSTDGNRVYPTYEGLRAITLIATKKKTNIQRVTLYGTEFGYRRPRYVDLDLTYAFTSQAYCDGIAGRICDGQAVTACIPRGIKVERVQFQTEGSNSGRYTIRFGYR